MRAQAGHFPIDGFRFSALAAGIKRADADKLDFSLIVSDVPAVVAGSTTNNLVYAAPVAITRECLGRGSVRAILINSGNANAYTGERGKQNALDLTKAVAKQLGEDSSLVLPMSTGVIGNPLPMERMLTRVPDLVERLDEGSFLHVAEAMMTTDTKSKVVRLDGRLSTGGFRIVGAAKGAGMIAPDMATMLAVILTDIRVDLPFLRECLLSAVVKSFNAITVDGDMSTNDTVVVMAGGARDSRDLGVNSQDREIFRGLLTEACTDLAKQIVLDGEGATKAVYVRVCGAPDLTSATRVARRIAESPLVKTAFHGEDPNWGRIVCAAGSSGVLFDPDRINLSIGDVTIVKDGNLFEDNWESLAHKVMGNREFEVVLDLAAGSAETVILTTDLSEEYVSINADYRS